MRGLPQVWVVIGGLRKCQPSSRLAQGGIDEDEPPSLTAPPSPSSLPLSQWAFSAREAMQQG